MLHGDVGTILAWMERRDAGAGPKTATAPAVSKAGAVMRSVVAGTRNTRCLRTSPSAFSTLIECRILKLAA